METCLENRFSSCDYPLARMLILGTMPSEQSLKRHEYYGNSRNQFWRIMQAMFGIPLDAPYATRIAKLSRQHITFQGVLHSCERVGSLDNAIKNVIPHDFIGFFTEHPNLKVIAINGKKAAEWFKRQVNVNALGLQRVILHSTSSAAAMSFEKKIAAWAVLCTL